MVKFDFDKIKGLEKIYRLNLINSCTGYKSANLIGSIDKEGNTNLAIFSSITHLGSDPAMIGFVLRPEQFPEIPTTIFLEINILQLIMFLRMILQMHIIHLPNTQKKFQSLMSQNLSLNSWMVLKLHL